MKEGIPSEGLTVKAAQQEAEQNRQPTRILYKFEKNNNKLENSGIGSHRGVGIGSLKA